MIYPVLTEFEWGIAGIIGIIILVFGIRSIARESRDTVKPHDYAHDKAFQRYIDKESAKVEEYYQKAKSDWEKEHGRSWDD